MLSEHRLGSDYSWLAHPGEVFPDKDPKQPMIPGFITDGVFKSHSEVFLKTCSMSSFLFFIFLENS